MALFVGIIISIIEFITLISLACFLDDKIDLFYKKKKEEILNYKKKKYFDYLHIGSVWYLKEGMIYNEEKDINNITDLLATVKIVDVIETDNNELWIKYKKDSIDLSCLYDDFLKKYTRLKY